MEEHFWHFNESFHEALADYVSDLRSLDSRWDLARADVPVPGPSLTVSTVDQATTMLRLLDQQGNDAVYRYAGRKMLLPCTEPGSDAHAFLLEQVVKHSVIIGEYREALKLTKEAADSPDVTAGSRLHRSLLLNRAKALRNKGEYDDAIRCYRRLLQAYDNSEASLDRAMHLLRIAKVYQNYAQQPSLCRFCINGALREVRLAKPTNETERRLAMGIRAIALDLEGQFRARTLEGAAPPQNLQAILNFFEKARRLHIRAENPEGALRARAHYIQTRAVHDATLSPQELVELVSQYRDEILGDELDYRGLGVRSLHLAEMFHRVGSPEARHQLAKAIRISGQLRDCLTYVRARFLEARLLSESLGPSGDPGGVQRIYDILDEARTRAKDYGLLRQEANASKLLLNLILGHEGVVVDPANVSDVITRMSMISEVLLGRLRSTHRTLREAMQKPEKRPPEFRNLGRESWAELLNELIDDFRSIFTFSTSELYKVATMVDKAGRRLTLQNSMSTGVALAKRLVHDLDKRLNNTGFIREQTEELLASVRRLQASSATENPAFPDLIERGERVLGFVEGLENLKQSVWPDIVDENLKGRPSDIGEMIDRVKRQVSLDMRLEGKHQFKLHLDAKATVQYVSPLFEGALENLIRNALQAAQESGLAAGPDRPMVKVSLTNVRIGVGANDAQGICLSVLNLSRPDQERQLEGALLSPGQSTRGGYGVGSTIIVFTFEHLLNTTPRVVRDGDYAGVVCVFRYGSLISAKPETIGPTRGGTA